MCSQGKNSFVRSEVGVEGRQSQLEQQPRRADDVSEEEPPC
jgi:hypothetical protein